MIDLLILGLSLWVVVKAMHSFGMLPALLPGTHTWELDRESSEYRLSFDARRNKWVPSRVRCRHYRCIGALCEKEKVVKKRV